MPTHPFGALLQVPVHQPDDDGALANGGGDTVGGSVPHVTGSEDAGDARLELQRCSREGPALGWLTAVQEIRPRDHVALLVALDILRQPVRARLGANEGEKGGGRYGLDVSGGRVLERKALEASLPTPAHDASVQPHPDVASHNHLVEEV